MGENTGLPETVIGIFPDGSCFTFRPGDLEDYDPTEYGYARDDPGPPGDPGLPWDQQSVTLTAECSKYFRCRSRKRLIKLLMANKFSRREAEGVAWYFHDLGWNYHDAWQAAWPGLLYK